MNPFDFLNSRKINDNIVFKSLKEFLFLEDEMDPPLHITACLWFASLTQMPSAFHKRAKRYPRVKRCWLSVVKVALLQRWDSETSTK